MDWKELVARLTGEQQTSMYYKATIFPVETPWQLLH